MFVIKHKKFFLILSAVFVVGSLFAVAVFGLSFGIDFTGGSLVEVSYEGMRPETTLLQTSLQEAEFVNTLLQPTGEQGYIVRTQELDVIEHARLLDVLSLGGESPLEELRFNSVGGVIGQELQNKAWIALLLTLAAIILYMTYSFRKVSQPVQSWKYGLVSIIALIHNTIIPVGIFAVLGSYFIEYQVDILFVTALLAIFGFSVNDTIVIFDRVRENLIKDREERLHESFGEVVGKSISETITRSINISLAIIFVLASLYILGGVSTREFSLVLGLGVIFGTYSSICFAAPLLVTVERWQRKE